MSHIPFVRSFIGCSACRHLGDVGRGEFYQFHAYMVTSSHRTSFTTNVTQVRMPPVRVSPVRISPVRISLVRMSPARVSPVRISPAQISPERISPERMSPVRIAPVRMPPVRMSPIRMLPKCSYGPTPRVHHFSRNNRRAYAQLSIKQQLGTRRSRRVSK